MKKFIFIGVIVCLIGLGGCNLFETSAEKTPTGATQTNLEATVSHVTDAMKNAAPIANTFYPGAGFIIGGLATIIGLITHSVSSVVTSRKNSGVASTVIKGVEIASKTYDDLQISLIAMFQNQPDVQTKIKDVFNSTKSIKEIIQDVSVIANNAFAVDKMVSVVTPALVSISNNV